MLQEKINPELNAHLSEFEHEGIKVFPNKNEKFKDHNWRIRNESQKGFYYFKTQKSVKKFIEEKFRK